jgi:hypothetical protein
VSSSLTGPTSLRHRIRGGYGWRGQPKAEGPSWQAGGVAEAALRSLGEGGFSPRFAKMNQGIAQRRRLSSDLSAIGLATAEALAEEDDSSSMGFPYAIRVPD